jgi:hypothetical protein
LCTGHPCEGESIPATWAMSYASCFIFSYVGGPKVLTNFTVQWKIINSQEKCETNFIWWIHSKSFFIPSAHFIVGILCRTENIQSKFQFFPCVSQHASVDCCDDIPDPCLQIFNSCNLGSTNLILNITPQKEV